MEGVGWKEWRIGWEEWRAEWEEWRAECEEGDSRDGVGSCGSMEGGVMVVSQVCPRVQQGTQNRVYAGQFM